MSDTYYQNLRPPIARCGGPGGCNVPHNPETSSQLNDNYIGEGFFQKITNKANHLQFDWVVKPNVFNHTTLAYDRWNDISTSLSQGVGWLAKLGITGLVQDTAGPPQLGFSGNIPYSYLGDAATGGHFISNRYQLLDDVTWLTGKHTLKVGFEYRYMQFPQQTPGNTGGIFNFSRAETGGYDAAGNNLSQTGDPFASFLLGQLDNANFDIHRNFTTEHRYGAPWINDDIKVTPKLTLSLGLRWDYQSALSEEFNRFSTFDPNTPNPGAGGLPGAMIFAGSGPGPDRQEHLFGSKMELGPTFRLCLPVE